MRRTVVPLYVKRALASYAQATRLIAVCACVGISACGAGRATDGIGFLMAADLRSVTPPHFTSPPTPVDAELVLRDKGCVAVDIGGTQRMPIWPDGTRIVDSEADPGNYTVTLSTGTTFKVSTTGGSDFKASGVIDDVRGPLGNAEGTPGKVQRFLDYCGIPDEPVLFPDAASFTTG